MTMGRLALPVAIGAVLAAAVAGAAFLALQLLPRPAQTVVFGGRIAQAVSDVSIVRGVERVGRSRVVTVCSRLSGQDYLLTIGNHRRFVIDGSTLAPLESRWHRGEALAVEVALSGCPSLLRALVERLVLPGFQRRARVPVQAMTENGAPVYRVALTNRLTLIVSRRTLLPLSLRLAGTRLSGTSVLSGAGAAADSRRDEED